MLAGHTGTGHLDVLSMMTCFLFVFPLAGILVWPLVRANERALRRPMCCPYILVKPQKAKSGSGSQSSFFMAGRSNDQVEKMLLEVLRLLTL